MNPKPFVMQLLAWRQRSDFERACRDPERAQSDLWTEIWTEIGDSPYWATKRPSENPRLEDFPITEYDDYRATLEKSFTQTTSDLNGKSILIWCTTSGTSGYRKVFPLTQLMLKQMQRTTKPYSFALAKNRPRAVAGKILYCAATRSDEKTRAGVEVGYISSFIYRSLPNYIKKSYAFPSELFASSAVFEEWSSLYAVAHDCSLLLAITPATLTALAKSIVKNTERDLSILKGRAPWPQGLPPVEVSRERLETIKVALSGDELKFRALWPMLDCITTWKGSTCALQLPELQTHLDEKVLVTDGQYSATEGWMTVPFVDSRVGSAFHPGAHIVEFMEPEADIETAKILKPWELEKGKDYEVLLTTAMGFVRYRLRDVVACRGFHERSPILEFRTKAGGAISIGQARFSEIEIAMAMSEVGFQAKGKWIFAPSAAGDGLELVTDQQQDPVTFERFAQRLGEINPDIIADIERGLLKPLSVKVAPDLALWKQSAHAQTKQKVISKTPLT